MNRMPSDDRGSVIGTNFHLKVLTGAVVTLALLVLWRAGAPVSVAADDGVVRVRRLELLGADGKVVGKLVGEDDEQERLARRLGTGVRLDTAREEPVVDGVVRRIRRSRDLRCRRPR